MAEDEAIPTPPEGFVLMTDRGPFGAHNGPYFLHAGASWRMAFFVLKRHTNKLGVAHGGMMAAFMDTVLGETSMQAAERQTVTVQFSVDYLRMARAGEWVVGRAAVTRLTRDLVFVEGGAQVGSLDVVRARGIFKVMRSG